MTERFKFLEDAKIRLSEEWEDLKGKMPPQMAELVENEKFIIAFMAGVLILAGYFLNYLPYEKNNLLEVQLKKEKDKGRTLTAKESNLRKLFAENTEKSKSDSENFEELKKKLFAVEFKDPLEVVEYIQGGLNGQGMDLNSVGQIEIIAEKLDGTESQKVDGNVEGTLKADENVLPKVEVSYNLTSGYDQLAQFLTEMETGEAFIEFRNNPITISLKDGEVVATTLKASGYADKLILGDSSLKEALESDDNSLKNKIFSRAQNEGLKNGIAGASIVELRGKLYGVLHMKNGRSFQITNGKIFRLPSREREDSKEYLVTIEDGGDKYSITFKERNSNEVIIYNVVKNKKY